MRIALRRARRLPVILLVLLVGAIVGTSALVVPGARRRQRLLQRILSAVARGLLVGFGLDCDWHGPAPRGPALIAGNHLSWIDIVAAIATWPCTFVAKREVRAWPVLGRLAAALGVVFVDRARKRDLLTAIPAIEQALGRGALILLFPEGTTSDGRGILRFRTALFESAVRAGAPVFPVALSGSVDWRSAEDDVSDHTSGETASRDRGNVLCWCGDETLVANVWRLVAVADARFSVRVGAPVNAGPNRKTLALRVRREIERRFVPVHARAPERAQRASTRARWQMSRPSSRG
jgi:1-acyl-sn-glycerol-3-phosphate acyltransferase